MTDRPRNPPGRPQLQGRIGTQATFLERMQQRLASWSVATGPSAGGLPLRALTPLQELTPDKGSARGPSLVWGEDYTHGVLDAWAVLGDVLTFYQERILNEGYLRTATEDFSVQELVKTLDVLPAPPLASRVDLCFTLSDKPGAPEALELPKGLAVQSIPGPEGKPQVFEISTPLLTRSEWNALAPWKPKAPTGPEPLRADARALLLQDGTQALRPGDLLLLRGQRSGGQPWTALKKVQRLGRSRARGCSVLAWDEPLDASLGTETLSNVEAWTLRAPEALFGADAKAWGDLALKDRLKLGTPWGGLQRMDAPWSEWKNLTRALPPGNVLSLGTHEGHVLVSVEGQGLLRSKDAGETWEALALPTAHVDVLCLGQDTQGRLIAGTRRHGVMRSADGGGAWELLKGQIVVETSAVPLTRNPRKDLRMPPTPVRSLAAFQSGNDKSAAAFIIAGTDEGVFCWEEATATWRPFNEGLPLGKEDASRVPVSVWAVVADPTRATFLVATSHGVFQTKQLGDKWERKDPGRAGQEAVAALVDAQGRLFVALEDGTLYRSTDGAKTYTAVTPKTDKGNAPVRTLSLGVANKGAPAPVLASTSLGVFVSRDGGTSWVTPPAMEPVNVTAAVELAPSQLLAATPLLGVKEQQWPHWPLVPGQLDLSHVMPRLAAGQPLVLEQVAPDKKTVRHAFLSITDAASVRVEDFGARQLVTRLRVEPVNPEEFDRGTARVYPAGVRLPLWLHQVRDNGPLGTNGSLDAVLDADASYDTLVREARDTPSDDPTRLRMDGIIPDPTGRLVLVTGRRMRLQVSTSTAKDSLPVLKSSNALEQQPLNPGQYLEVLARPDTGTKNNGGVTWRLRTERGFAGEAAFSRGQHTLVPSDEKGDIAVERRRVVDIVEDVDATVLVLDEPLTELLDPATLVVYANVAEATHGLTVQEVLGSGDANLSFQSFRLKRSPLVWRATDDGPVPDIDVWVDKRRWHRAESWYGQGPDSHVYLLQQDADGTTRVMFGDGVRGARLPTGQENVTATYRTGGGPDGNVEAGRIRLLRQRPLGLKAVDNPLPASGGTAAEDSASLRTRAPMRVRTLDRIVSPRDFEDFVRTYPGVARVRARQVWNGREHVLFLTVATEEEASQHQLLPGSSLDVALRQTLQRFRPATHPVDLGSYVPRYFELEATLVVDADADPKDVKDTATQALADAYRFERRELAQPVVASDLLRLLSGLTGVLNVRLTTLRPHGETPTGPVPAQLLASDIRWDAKTERILPAELWLLDVKTGLTLNVENGP